MSKPTSTMYCRADIKPGDSVHYNHLDKVRYDHATQELTILECTAWGDYSGGTINAANQRFLLADEEAKSVLVSIHGNHGYSALAVIGPLADAPECIREAVESAEYYPALDEELLAQVEMEAEDEAWGEWAAREFAEELVKVCTKTGYLTDESVDTLADMEPNPKRLWRVWRNGCEKYNVEGGSGVTFGEGAAIHFRMDHWLDRWLASDDIYPDGYNDDDVPEFDNVFALLMWCHTPDNTPDPTANAAEVE